MHLTPRDLEFQAVRRYAREAISAVFGVPPTVLGIPDTANYAVSRQSARNYWEVQTKRGKKISHLFTQIARKFDRSFRVEIDYSGVEALQDVRDAQLDRVSKNIMNGMDPADAYTYEGLEDAPIIPADRREDPVDDIGDEEGQNVRSIMRLLKAEKEIEQYDLKKNSLKKSN